MTMISASAAASATAPLPRGSNPAPSEAIFAAAGLLLPHLERGDRVDAATLRSAMETAFGASDATGAFRDGVRIRRSGGGNRTVTEHRG